MNNNMNEGQKEIIRQTVWVIHNYQECILFKNKSLALNWLKNRGLKKKGNFYVFDGEFTEYDYTLSKHLIRVNEVQEK